MGFEKIGNIPVTPTTQSGGAGGGPHDHPHVIHDNVAYEITPIEPKYEPVTTDVILIEDSEDADRKKAIALGWLFGQTSTQITTSTGGTKTLAGGYVYHDFTADGTLEIEGSQYVDILLVGGGGGGGGAGGGIGPGGGGGGGEVKVVTNHLLEEGTYAMVVGAGGTGGTGVIYPNGANSTGGANGESSTGLGYTATGGGGGGTANSGQDPGGSNGASGGGGGYNTSGGTGLIIAHGDGGAGDTGSPFDAGGGGGSADDGDDGSGAGNPAGGVGTFVNEFSTFGGEGANTAGWFGGGGGGGRWGSGDTSFTHDGETFGGGDEGSVQGTNFGNGGGLANTGGGGGGARDQQFGLAYDGSDGGSGRVIVRWLEEPEPGSGIGSGGLGGGTAVPITINDQNAIHDNVSAEISAITNKASPTNDDYILIEDAADSDSKKYITVGQLTGLVVDSDALHQSVAGEINGLTEKTDPDVSDLVVIEDSEAANVKKKVQLQNMANLFATETPYYEVIVSGSAPPVAVTNEAEDDWVYGLVLL